MNHNDKQSRFSRANQVALRLFRLILEILDLLLRLLAWLLRPPLRGQHSSELPPPACPIGWQPSVLAPVFYGVREVDPEVGAPVASRIFFPSLDGAVFDAPILADCGRYPLIVFVHGQCSEPSHDHYKKWFELPAQLARGGYIVVVPMLAGTASGDYPW